MTSLAPYMSGTLKSQGAYLQNYYATGHASLDNYISMMSGQPGAEQTNGDCGDGFNNFQGVVDPTDGVDIGDGCVYPTSILTLGDQLSAAGISWRSYDEDMGNDAARDNTTATPFACGHPNPGTPVGQTDPTQGEEATDGYATRHDPFMYFHSIIDVTTGANACANHVVNLQHHFASDLSSLATTPQFSFISPSLCDDGHNTNCAESSADGTVGGLPGLDAYLRDTLIPTIQSSAAYEKDGLIIVIFDESSGDDTACCNEYGQASGVAASEGGGITGGVMLSPMIAGPVVDAAPYNHYSLLRYLEGVFTITAPTINGTPYLGYAMNATPFAAADLNNLGGPVSSAQRRFRR
jgi:hypothetical protein